jgi:hypothetical protein
MVYGEEIWDLIEIDAVKQVKELLMEQKELRSARNSDGDTLLHAAADNSSLSMVRMLVGDFKLDINAQNRYGDRAIQVAHGASQWDIVEYLAKKGSKDAEDCCNYKLKIVLLESDPLKSEAPEATSIWRQILIPGNLTMNDLHHAIQGAMGWRNSHLHKFELPNGASLEMAGADEDLFFNDEDEDIMCEDDFLIADIFRNHRTIEYLYDFGDDWCHQIICEEILSNRNRDLSEPRFIEGEMACPPEDVGGTYGYGRLLHILSDPTHEEHIEQKEWLVRCNYADFNANHCRIPPPEELTSDWYLMMQQRALAQAGW